MSRILFLEDEEILIENIPILLKEEGFDVQSTTSIVEALKRFAQENFDAVLLDIMMPPAENMNAEQLDYGRSTGIEVARRMKMDKPNVPIVAFTVITDPDIRKEMREAGIARIVTKPSEPNQIVNALRQAILDSPK